jgi:hypothetical protein
MDKNTATILPRHLAQTKMVIYKKELLSIEQQQLETWRPQSADLRTSRFHLS